MTWLLLLAPLAGQLALLYLLSGALNRVAFRRLGRWIYFLLMWPGVVVHELSHLVGCLLTRTRIFEVKLFSPREESPGNLILGYVSHAPTRNPVSTVIVSAAPFFGGAAALWLLIRLVVPRALAVPLAAPVGGGDLASLAGSFAAAAELYWRFAAALFSALDWSSWRSYVFLYFLFAFSAHIAPSRHDMKYAIGGAVGLGIILWFAVAIGARYTPAATAALAAGTAKAVAALTALLGYGLVSLAAVTAATFGIVLAVDAVRGRR